MPASSTGVRVFVEWDDEPIYAGDDVNCTITFKNVAPPLGANPNRASAKLNGIGVGGERRQKIAPTQPSHTDVRPRAPHAPRPPSMLSRGHRQTMSLNMPSGRGVAKDNARPAVGPLNGMTATGQRHQRSLSIISLGGSEIDGKRNQNRVGDGAGRPQERQHTRATSLQITPRRTGGMNGALISPGAGFIRRL